MRVTSDFSSRAFVYAPHDDHAGWAKFIDLNDTLPDPERIFNSPPFIFNSVVANAAGPEGSLPLTEKLLLNAPSGTIFGLSQNVGMGWDPDELTRKQFLILSTQGGIRAEDGTPRALGYHTGHWEIGLLASRAALEFKDTIGAIPFSGMVSDPCDGRSMGTKGMYDSLPYRTDAATVFRRLIRSLPTRSGVMGIGSCDKGLPALMTALSSMHDLPTIVVPGGVTLPAKFGEDAGKIQSIGARFAHGEITLQEASDLGCRACASPGGGCQFLGTAATSQVVAEALGFTVPHAALSPSGSDIWYDIAIRSSHALASLEKNGITTKDIITPGSIRNAMVVHAAFGGSTNLLIHIPAIAYACGIQRPTVQDWIDINRSVPRLVDVLPNGPHPTVNGYLAGGVPEVMLHLRDLGLLDLNVKTVSGKTLKEVLEWWENSERRKILRSKLTELTGINPDDVIMSPDQAKEKGLTSTVTFPVGNITPEGSVIKSTAIDPKVVDDDGVYRKVGPVKFFTDEQTAIKAVKGKLEGDLVNKNIQAGDIMVLACLGPVGRGMPETFEITSALKHLSFGNQVALVTDGRFSGVSTGACIGHVGPEALAGGPIGKLRDGDIIEIIIDRNKLVGSINFVGEGDKRFTVEEGAKILADRMPRPDLKPADDLPDDTRLWAALQGVSGGVWAGCVYDTDIIISTLQKGQTAGILENSPRVIVDRSGNIDEADN